MKIVYIGNFNKLWDEEYIARSFEQLGHEVFRYRESTRYTQLIEEVLEINPDFVIYAKFRVGNPDMVMKAFKNAGIKTVCWVFDLYWGYTRQYRITTDHMFKADIVFSTDGGHEEHWKKVGINHKLLRQGIYAPECRIGEDRKDIDVLFVGSYNPDNRERNKILSQLGEDFNFVWAGKRDTDEYRGENLTDLIARAKIVVGDSVYSPHYWSNRVVETLGRGGFLIHVEVEGIREEYPDLCTYDRGNYADLKAKIEYYLEHDEEREEIIRKNFELVSTKYTCLEKCKELIKSL